MAGGAGTDIAHRRAVACEARAPYLDARVPHQRLALLLRMEGGKVAHILVRRVRSQRLLNGARALAGLDLSEQLVRRQRRLACQVLRIGASRRRAARAVAHAALQGQRDAPADRHVAHRAREFAADDHASRVGSGFFWQAGIAVTGRGARRAAAARRRTARRGRR